MEMPGAIYLFNLSLLAFGFATISALVMLFRHSMGGQLSSFDVYLMTAFIALSFTIGFVSLLPTLVDLYEPEPAVRWTIAGLIGAACLSAVAVYALRRRVAVAKVPTPFPVIAAFSTHWAMSLVLIANAAFPQIRGPGPYATAVTLSLFAVLWSFVRRISSLLSAETKADWDVTRG